MNEYQKFAYFYDEIYEAIDYTQWLDYMKPYLKDEDTILDLACGSGTLALLLKIKGYSVEGLDLSETMIDLANQKAKMHHIDIPFYVEDMTSFSTGKTYDIITCFFDSINFLETKEQLKALFSCVKKHLKPNGYFIFDLFSKRMLRQYSHHKLHKVTPIYSLLWKTKKTSATSLQHQIIIKEDKQRMEEIYDEYYHEVKDLPIDGFKLIQLTGDFKEIYTKKSERILVVLKKIGCEVHPS